MPKVKLTESELRKVVATILNEQEPPEIPDAAVLGSAYTALEVLPLGKIIDQSLLCKSLADLCALTGTTISTYNNNNLAYRYGLLTEHALKEFGITGISAIAWNNENPNAPLNAAKQYLKVRFLSLVTGKAISLSADSQGDPGFNLGPDENTDDLGYIVDPNTPTLVYWPGVFKNYGEPDKKCLQAIKPEVTEFKVIASAEVWNKLDNLSWVNAVIKNWKTLVRQQNGKGFAYCDQPEAVQAAQAEIAAEITSTVKQFNETYKLIDTKAFDAFFVVPLMYPSIWRAVKDDESPLYTPWSMTLSVCNMMNNALSLPGGGAALAKKLTEASSKGLVGQGAQASVSGFDPRVQNQFLFLRESARIMVTLPELRRVIRAAFSTIISEQRRQRRDNQLLLKESALGTLFTKTRDAVVAGGTAIARVARSSEEEAAQAASLAKSLAAEGVDAQLAKHYTDLIGVIAGLSDDVRATVLSNIEENAAKSYQAILTKLKETFFSPDNTRYTPKSGRTLDQVKAAPCVLKLTAAPGQSPDILERVRVALNCGAALATAQRADNAADILSYTEELRRILTVSADDRVKIQGIIDSLSANNVNVDVNRAARNLFGDDPNTVVSGVINNTSVDEGIPSGQQLTRVAIDPEELNTAAQNIAIDPRAVTLRTGDFIKFVTVDAQRPGSFIELDPSMRVHLGNKRYLSDVSVDEIKAAKGGAGGIGPDVKKNLIAVRMLIDDAITDSAAEFDDQERVVTAAQRAVVNDASEGVVRGALTNVRAVLADPAAASRQFTQGAEAAEGQGLLSRISTLGKFKYDPDTAEDFWAEGLKPEQRVAALANFAGRITFFFEKGMPRYVDDYITERLDSLGDRGVVGKGFKYTGKVAQSLLSSGYSRKVTNSLEALAEAMPALGLDKLARTNWTKMWLTKSIVTALASIVLAKTGAVGPQWEADHPRLATFANLLLTINNPNMFQLGIFEVTALLFEGSDPTATFTNADLTAIFDPGVPDLLTNALKSLDVNTKPDPGSFPSLMQDASVTTGVNFDNLIIDTVIVVGNVIDSIMNAGTDVGRSVAESAEADLASLSGAVQAQIDNVKAAAATPARGLKSLDVGNENYKQLEALRLDIIKTMIGKIETFKKTGTLEFQTLGYQNLNVDVDKTETFRSGWDIWYGVRNANEMVAMSSVLAGSGPIGPSGAPAATLDDIASILISSGAPIAPNDTETPEIQKLNDKFMKLSAQWQDLLITQAAQEEAASATTSVAPASAKP